MAETGLRERKKAATRAALRTAAHELLAEAGPEGFTVDDVCARVGVSQRTFFNHFPTKEAALIALDPEVAVRARKAVRERPPGEDPYTAVGAVIADVNGITPDGAAWSGHATLLRRHPQLLATSTLVGFEMEQALAAGVAARTGAAPDDPEPAVVAATVLAATRVAMRRWLAAPPGTDARALLAEILAVQRRVVSG